MTSGANRGSSAIWLRRALYSLLGLSLLAMGIVGGLLWYKPSPTEITLTGKSDELGAAYGHKVGRPMRLMSRFYLDRIVCEGNPKLIDSSRKAALANLSNWPACYRDEINAMAATAQIPVSALAFGNSFLDLGRVRAGCRSVVVSQSNVVFHAHNLDWDNLGGLGRWVTCIARRYPSDGRLATVSIGFPGMIGAVDIINEKGMALSFNQFGRGKGETNEPVLIMLRRIAETCDSLQMARTNLLSAPAGMPFIITVSDSRQGTGSVFERVHGRISERRLQKGFVAACNTTQGIDFGLTHLDRTLAKLVQKDASGIQGVLGSSEVMMQCNIYSVVFDFQHNRFWLASGEVPAAAGSYREFPLFR